MPGLEGASENGEWSALRTALLARARQEALLEFEFARLLGAGRSPADAANDLGLTAIDAYRIAARILDVASLAGLSMGETP